MLTEKQIKHLSKLINWDSKIITEKNLESFRLLELNKFMDATNPELIDMNKMLDLDTDIQDYLTEQGVTIRSKTVEELLQENLQEAHDYIDQKADSLQNFISAITSYPVLTDEEVLELYPEYLKGSEEAKNALIFSNAKMAIKQAFLWKRDFSEIEDILQEGLAGMADGLRKYKPVQGKLSSYMNQYMRRDMYRFVLRNQSLIIRSENTNRRADFIRNLQNKAVAENGAPLTVSEVRAHVAAEELRQAGRLQGSARKIGWIKIDPELILLLNDRWSEIANFVGKKKSKLNQVARNDLKADFTDWVRYKDIKVIKLESANDQNGVEIPLSFEIAEEAINQYRLFSEATYNDLIAGIQISNYDEPVGTDGDENRTLAEQIPSSLAKEQFDEVEFQSVLNQIRKMFLSIVDDMPEDDKAGKDLKKIAYIKFGLLSSVELKERYNIHVDFDGKMLNTPKNMKNAVTFWLDKYKENLRKNSSGLTFTRKETTVTDIKEINKIKTLPLWNLESLTKDLSAKAQKDILSVAEKKDFRQVQMLIYDLKYRINHTVGKTFEESEAIKKAAEDNMRKISEVLAQHGIEIPETDFLGEMVGLDSASKARVLDSFSEKDAVKLQKLPLFETLYVEMKYPYDKDKSTTLESMTVLTGMNIGTVQAKIREALEYVVWQLNAKYPDFELAGHNISDIANSIVR